MPGRGATPRQDTNDLDYHSRFGDRAVNKSPSDRRRSIMRRLAVVMSAVLVMVLGVVAIVSQPGVIAQEATPAAADEAMAEEEIFAILSYGVAEVLPPAPAGVVLLRLNLEPGDSFELAPEDPATGVLYIETGTLTVNVPVPMTVLRAAGPGTPFPMVNEDTENVAAG